MTILAQMDGHAPRNPFRRENWNLAIDKGWIRTEEVKEEQWTTIKGYLTEKGRRELDLAA
jgi:hypothetical protein